MSYDPSKSLWFNPNIEYLFNNTIVEYDIKDAGLTIIKEFKLLDDSKIKELENIDKMGRHISIGKIQRDDKELSRKLLEKFTDARAIFIDANKIEDDNILSVKKDAIYTIGEYRKLKFGKLEFLAKNRYSSYIRFTDNMNIELYYSSNGIDVKGIGGIGVNRHRLYMMQFLDKVISYLEGNDQRIKRYLRLFVNDYKSKKLDDGYYIEFNNLSRDYNPMYNYQKIIIPIVQIALKCINK